MTQPRPWTHLEIAARVAADLPAGAIVNLGIGLPTLVAASLDPAQGVILHSENGIIGLGPPPAPDMRDSDIIDAGKSFATLITGASIVDQATSFSLIRGGRLDVAVLGAFQIAQNGDLANWRVAGAALGSVGGAMDLAVGARQRLVMMTHVDKTGSPKLVAACTFPLTARACVQRVYTDLAVVNVTGRGFVVRDLAPGVTLEYLQSVTGAPLR